MTPEKWQIVKSLFATVQEIPAGKRQEYLFRASGGDHEISGEVIKLLDSYSEDDEFLENSAVAEVASMFEENGPMGESNDEADKPRFAKGALLDRRYEIIRLLGKGGMGEVYLANDKNLERKVALKVLPSELTESKSRLRRFEQEARAVSALNHPHILTIFEFGESGDGDHYIASEYVEGKTLNALNASRELSLNKVLDIAMQVSSALAAAHEAGITHRDIKPDNIMVRNDGYIKVLDFGLAKLTEPEGKGSTDSEAATRAQVNTAPGSVMGTAAYMSPEQARGLNVDARTDIWSLGVVMYELVTGQQPFKGDTSTDTIIAVIKKEPPPISAYVAHSPPEIEWIILKTLSKERDGRYQTAKELHADIAKIKKHVEFLDERERTSQPDKSADGLEESPTMLLEGPTTDLREVEKTREITEGTNDSEYSGRQSSFEYAVMGATRHKGLSAVLALVLFAAISFAVYYLVLAPATNAPIDSIAVLPLENGNSGPEFKYLSEGISESLIDRLSQLPQLKVIARSSSWKFAGPNIDVRDVARQLGVRAILMGKVSQVNGLLKIRVELIDAKENRQLWSSVYERKPSDLLILQNEIAHTVSRNLSLELTRSQQDRLADSGTTNSDAFRNYLSGMVEVRATGSEGKGIEYFLKAVELDPSFAPAYAEISRIYSNRSVMRGNPGELMPKAKQYAVKALELDNELASAHVSLATVREFEFDWRGAEASYKRAIELSPNLDSARNRYSFFLSVMGRHEEAAQQTEQAMLRDPINKRLHLQFQGMNLVQARKFDEGIAAFIAVQKMKVAGNDVDFQLGYAYAGKGMNKEAAALFEKSADSLGGRNKYSQSLVYLAATYAKMPAKRAEAIAIQKRLESTNEYVSPALMAVLYAALNENGKALDALEEAFEEKDVLLRYIKVAYEYDNLRSEPRFKKLLEKTGLAK